MQLKIFQKRIIWGFPGIFILLITRSAQPCNNYEPCAFLMKFYEKSGIPGLDNQALPDTIRVSTEDTVSIWAKIMDDTSGWRLEFESPPLSDTIKWSVVPRNNNSNVNVTEDGANLVIAAESKYNTVELMVTASSSFPGMDWPDTLYIQMYTMLDSPYQISIEPDSVYNQHLIFSRSVNEVTLTELNSPFHLYAYCRDRYGNFIHFFTSLQWRSLDTTVVKVNPGDINTGEVLLHKVGSGTTEIQYSPAGDTSWTSITVVAQSTGVNSHPAGAIHLTGCSEEPVYFDMRGRKIRTANRADLANGIHLQKKTGRISLHSNLNR